MIMSEAIILFKEQYAVDGEEAAAHKFILREPVTNGSVDWDSIDIFHEEMDMVPEALRFRRRSLMSNKKHWRY
jgi:hypothetical protein